MSCFSFNATILRQLLTKLRKIPLYELQHEDRQRSGYKTLREHQPPSFREFSVIPGFPMTPKKTVNGNSRNFRCLLTIL